MSLLEGRFFTSDDPRHHVIVNEHFARRFWPGGAEGHTFRRSETDPAMVIVGVVGHVRTADERRTGTPSDVLLYYTPQIVSPQSPSVVRPPAPVGIRRTGGPASAFVPLLVRLDAAEQLATVLATVRAEVPQFAVRASMVEDDYAAWEGETLLQMQVISAFGVLALLTAVAGVYGVMAFLVARRTRELGLRMALGATHRDVMSLVLGSATRLTILGALIGLLGAGMGSRFVESELFGVSPTDPLTYLSVALVVSIGATVATWLPARRAARVDPAITLRSE
jgi:hypothetical protein